MARTSSTKNRQTTNPNKVKTYLRTQFGRSRRSRILIAAGIIGMFGAIGGIYAMNQSSAASCRTVTLREGSRGGCVRLVQRWLGPQNTGYFGPATKRNVISFQRGQGLPQTGVVSTLTWAAICRQLHFNPTAAREMAAAIGCNYKPNTRTWQ